MGGDHGPEVTIPASLDVLRKNPDLKLIFVGQEEVVTPLLKRLGQDLANRWSVHHASEIVAMDEAPATALRQKKDSSMRVSINLVKEGVTRACVSAGNTGALMATAKFVLKTLPGIDRPAIMTRLPSMTEREVRVLDLGANVDSSAEQLFQFGLMASVLTKAVESINEPRVALLNIGTEEIKGTEQVKQAAELFSNCDAINYVGYIEADNIFTGSVDVVVCDGFVGNVALKSCEGLSKLLKERVKDAFMRSWLTKLSYVPAIPVFNKLKNRIDPRRRNGATLIGLQGTVIKSHGGADQLAFSCALEEAILEMDKNIPELIRQEVTTVMSQRSQQDSE